MMPVIKTMLMKMQKINKEYILLFIVVALLGFLIYSSTATSQVDAVPLSITTFYPSPFGEFNEVLAIMFRDFDNPMNFYCDPSGTSSFQSLQVFDGITTRVISSPAILGLAPDYSINFETGNANLEDVYAVRFIMGDPGPTASTGTSDPDDWTQRSAGKYVYDISEGIKAEDCQAGDVVLISSDENINIVKSSKRFDSRVAGVISEDPKIYMGAGQGKVPLALAGIVKCNVSTENGSIQRGDLLVTSSLSGHAMKAEPDQIKPGMLIGKALEPLKEKTGKIFILVNKQ